MAKLKFYNSFDDSRPPEVTTFDKSMTIESQAIGLSVREIMERFSITGTIPDRGVPGQFLDTTVLPDMFGALNMRVSLDEYFNGLNPKTRFEFENDPMKLVAFVNDPKNFSKALDMGLLSLNEAGLKAKADWESAQAKLSAENRKKFEADISQIIKSVSPPDGK